MSKHPNPFWSNGGVWKGLRELAEWFVGERTVGDEGCLLFIMVNITPVIHLIVTERTETCVSVDWHELTTAIQAAA